MTSVSVVITCYNLGAYLEEALHSALAQTYPEVEVLVVDDGSTDPATVAVLDRLPAHPRLRVLRTPNQGVARARNYGFAQARGEYILPLDADDRIHPEYVARAAAVLDACPEVGFVGCHYRLFGERQGEYRPQGYHLPDLLVENVVPIASLLRRRCWQETGGYCPELNSIEDWDLWIGIVERGYRGAVLPEILFEYRVRPNSNLSLVRDPDVYQRRMALLYERHRALFDRHVYEVLRGKDRQYAILHQHMQWLEQQVFNWERVAREQQQALEALSRRGAVGRWPVWRERQLARWRRIAAEQPTWVGRAQVVLRSLQRIARERARLAVRRLMSRL
ncbi:MAG TPA: glycosyltransferase family A protein [Roseiflexaceae bacterium]|nr:glycosyltransferase family A protein [Roseiflexaceae bacterium]